MKAIRNKHRVKMIVQSPSDRNATVWLPYAVAWAAARGIAQQTHHAVILIGTRGTARFNGDGGGTVTWNEVSGEPGTVTRFDAQRTVCIN